MGEERATTDTNGVRNQAGDAIPYARIENRKSFWTAIVQGGFVAIIASMFVALSVANRDFSKQLGDNLQSIVTQWNRNFEKLSDRVYELEKWRWGRKK